MSGATKQRIHAALVGCGYIGPKHAGAYLLAMRDGLPCSLSIVCDRDLPVEGLPEPSEHIRIVGSIDEVLADPDIDLVDICTPTDTHVDLASRALRAGKHVLVEKPVSLVPEEIDALDALARECERLCMPAMCMRFWPSWDFMGEALRDGRFGPVRRATFHRLSPPPCWSDFYADFARSGGPLFDLHIHDADFITYAFGAPTSVETTGDEMNMTTRYTIPTHPGAEIVAEASWTQTPEQGFALRCTIECAKATLDFDLKRTPAFIITRGGSTVSHPPPTLDGYDNEVRALLDAIGQGAAEPTATLAEAAAVTRILHAERRSMTTRRPVAL